MKATREGSSDYPERALANLLALGARRGWCRATTETAVCRYFRARNEEGFTGPEQHQPWWACGVAPWQKRIEAGGTGTGLLAIMRAEKGDTPRFTGVDQAGCSLAFHPLRGSEGIRALREQWDTRALAIGVCNQVDQFRHTELLADEHVRDLLLQNLEYFRSIAVLLHSPKGSVVRKALNHLQADASARWMEVVAREEPSPTRLADCLSRNELLDLLGADHPNARQLGREIAALAHGVDSGRGLPPSR